MKTDKKHLTLEDYMKNRWENLDSPFNPTKFYGVVNKEQRDSSGMRIYDWDNKLKPLSHGKQE